jgi:amicyanin
MKRSRLLLLPLALLALAGCGSSSNSSPSAPATTQSSGGTAPASSGGAIKVDMKNLAFSPATINAKVGQTVTWTNDDTPAHNVTYVSGPKFNSSSTINPHGTFSFKLTEAGTIHYVCTIHPFMKGTIVVTK